jgi:hypothetical protein
MHAEVPRMGWNGSDCCVGFFETTVDASGRLLRLGQKKEMPQWRLPIRVVVVMILLLGGCGRRAESIPGNRQPDGGAGAWVGDTSNPDATLTDTVTDSGGSDDVNPGDAGSAGQCGSEIAFQIAVAPGVDPNTLCLIPCDGVSVILTSGTTQLWLGFVWTPDFRIVWTASPERYFRGAVSCDTCSGTPTSSCPGGIETFPAAGINRVWSGDYFASGDTCNGQPCMGPPACAPLGHYVATVCVTRGGVSGNVCIPSQNAACSTVEFDLPSTTTLAVELGA